MSIKESKKLSRGFTAIELVISIFVLSMGLIAIFNAFSVIIILTADQADRLTATYLAQEGMEIIRNIRDTNWVNHNKNPKPLWFENLDLEDCRYGCQADYSSSRLLRAHEYLFLDSTAGFYNYSFLGNQTRFKRKILIEKLDEVPTAIKIITEVSWDQKATIFSEGKSADNCETTLNCIRAESTLYDWFGYTLPSI